MSIGEKSEKRRERRSLATVPVECRMPNGENIPVRGITVNVSPSGLSFYTHRQLDTGVSIFMTGAELWQGSRQGTVQWCTRIMGGLYRVGMLLN